MALRKIQFAKARAERENWAFREKNEYKEFIIN